MFFFETIHLHANNSSHKFHSDLHKFHSIRTTNTMSEDGETKENDTMSDISEPPRRVSQDSPRKVFRGYTSTEATEEYDSYTEMGSTFLFNTKNSSSNNHDDADDVGSSSDLSKTQEEKVEKKRIEEVKITYEHWPLKRIKEPLKNDVMCGRGAGSNNHPGNKRYRDKVENRKVKYAKSTRLEKPEVTLEIIREWRAQSPPGRFLKLNTETMH
jgi:hypothetical protein